MRDFLQIFGPLLGSIAVVPYVYDVIRGRTKPNIVSWSTWALLTGIGTAAIIAGGDFRSSLLPLNSTICTIVVVILAIKFGFAKYTRLDKFCQLGAIVGLLLWFIFDAPLVALVITIIIDLLASIPTYNHAWKAPGEETWETFAIASVGAFLTLLAVKASAITMVYPIYLMLLDGGIAIITVYRRKQKGISLRREGKIETVHEDI